MTFEAYNGSTIELSTEVWENHIKVNHPEIGLLEIELALKDPDEVWVSHKDKTQSCITNERKSFH